MQFRHWWFTVALFLIQLIKHFICVEPITITLGAAAAGGSMLAYWGYCKKYECCKKPWTRHKPEAIQQTLDENLFGQHLVNDIVAKVIVDHISNEDPKKALAISFHGWTGSGKNYAGDLITNLLYYKGTKSKFVHKRISTLHYSDDSKLEEYKNQVRNLIETSTKACPNSLFIFDEIDKMPVGLADVLKPYLDYYPEINGVDFRKNIFIFLSNTGGEKINKETYKHFKEAKRREEITRRQMETLLKAVAFNMDGGFKSSDLILSSLIDFFIPFLPLERKHVKECVKVALRKRGKPVNDEKLTDKIANELQYFPKGDETFSTSGCKLVDKKTSSHI